MKKMYIIIVCLIIVSILVFGYSIYNNFKIKKILKKIGGSIVYAYRIDGEVLDIYSISPDGDNKKLLYHNNDKINSNSMFPRWSEDGKEIYFIAMKDGNWTNFKMGADGKNVSVVGGTAEPLSVNSRVSDLTVDSGNIFYDNGTDKLKIYSFLNIFLNIFYDSKYNPGASEVAWGPNKEFAIFESCSFFGCNIMVAGKNGNQVFKIAKGVEPDWK